jgi:hypothetical protein
VDGFIEYLTLLPDFHHNRIQGNNRVDRIQGSVLPDFAVFFHRLGDVGNQSGGNLDPLKVLPLGLDVASRHAIQGDDLVIKPLESGLSLGNQDRLKLT